MIILFKLYYIPYKYYMVLNHIVFIHTILFTDLYIGDIINQIKNIMIIMR